MVKQERLNLGSTRTGLAGVDIPKETSLAGWRRGKEPRRTYFKRTHGGPQQPKCRKHTNPIFSAMREDLLTIICMSGRLGGGIVGIIKKNPKYFDINELSFIITLVA